MASAGTITFTLDADNSKMLAALRQATGQVEKFADGAKRGVGQATSEISKAATKFAAMAVSIGGVTAAIRHSVGAFADFSAGLDRAAAVAGVSRGSSVYHKLEQDALELAKTSQYTATEVTSAYNFMAMAGMKTTDIMASTPAVLQLASAGAIELGAAADIVTNVMAGFGKEASELTRVNDLMVATITNSNVDVRQLGEAFKYAGPVAKAAGLSFEDAAIAIGLMGNAGIQGSMAGTSLRGMLNALLNPSKKAAAILASIGVSALDSSGKVKPLREILKQLQDGGIQAGEAMEVFGLRAGPGLLAMVDQGEQPLKRLSDALETSDGRAKELSERTMSTLKGQFNSTAASVNALAIAFGKLLGPAVEDILWSVSKVAEYFTNVADNLRYWSGFLNAFMAAGFGDTSAMEKFLKNFEAEMEAKAAGVSTALGEASAKTDFSSFGDELKKTTRRAFSDGAEEAVKEITVSGLSFQLSGHAVKETTSGSANQIWRQTPTMEAFLTGLATYTFEVESEAQRLEKVAKRSEMNARLKEAVDARRVEGQNALYKAQREQQKTVLGIMSGALGQASGIVQGFSQGGVWGGIAAIGVEALKTTESFEEIQETFSDGIKVLGEFIDAFKPIIDLSNKFTGGITSILSKGADKLKGAVDKVAGWFGFSSDAIQEETKVREMNLGSMLAEFYGPELERAKSMFVGLIQSGRSLDHLDPELRDMAKSVGQDYLRSLISALAIVETGGASARELGFGDEQDLRSLISTTRMVLEDASGSIAQSLEEGSDIIGETVDGMNESLLNAPAGLKLALHRFKAIETAGSRSIIKNPESQAWGPTTQSPAAGNQFLGDITINGVTDVDDLLKQIQQKAAMKKAQQLGALAAARAAQGG